jgi:hypothetical protein
MRVSIGLNISGGGLSIQKTIVREADHPNPYEVTLPAGKVVTAWVKTDSNTAACNLPAGHGYADGNFDVYWTEAGVAKRRYGVVGDVTGDAIALDGGTGDNFPDSATVGVVVTRQVQINTTIDGDQASLFVISLDYTNAASVGKGHIDMQDAGSATVKALDLAPNAPFLWDGALGIAANPLTGNPITKSFASNGSSTEAATIHILSLDDRGLGSILTCEKPTDYDLLWEVLWHLIEPQAIELGITAEEFGQAMAADCLVDAKLIFLEEWRDFFRRLQRPDQAAALEKILQYQAKHLEIVQARLASPEMEEIDDRVQRALQKKANASFTSLRDSLDKVLSDSPGDSST